MKRYYVILMILPLLLSGCLRSLEKEGISNITVYKGRVIDADNKPLKGIMVRITNDQLIYNSVTTDIDGLFSIEVDINRIDKSYYLLIGDKETEYRQGQLKGFGQDIYDYGDIPFEDMKLPIVETMELIGASANSFTCRCHVQAQGGSSIIERGICWNTNIPTIFDNKEAFGAGDGIYICTICNENINATTTTYYARAYAINDENKVAYGESLEISPDKVAYFSLPTMEYGGFIYHIYSDLGGMQWGQANSACDNMIAFGYNDWYMPNKEEMLVIADKISSINQSYEYWTTSYTSNFNGTKFYYFIYYENSQISIGDDDNSGNHIHHVIPVRKDKKI